MNEREIFAGAIALDSTAERNAFLDDACGPDTDLRQRIEELLEDQNSLGSFLESPPPGVSATSHGRTITEQPGTIIGPYKLLQKIGEGGMGVVYMAEQREPVERRVALKIIKPGMDTEQVIARFEAERQALAMMDHQNIARVLDAGATETGRPFFVMELVKGVPITEYCDHNKLTPRERLDLFLPVCNAIQHAHQKGVIHRDVKPSNIMVTLYDGQPVPKIIDFGVAKATAQRLTEKTMFTLYGQIVGTLEYMSPEQAEMSALDIDTRSDIYSLGVVLYELLTGSTPLSMKELQTATLPEMLRMIRETEPQRPSTRLSHSGDALPEISAHRKMEPAKLSALVRGELDWIVLKALEKDRSRRFETASGLARDIERYLNDEPVEACPPSTWYRLRKQLRKHKTLVATAAAVVASLVVGLSVSTAMYWRAERARADADEARAGEQERANELTKALAARDNALKNEAQIADELAQSLRARNAALAAREAELERSEALRLAALSTAALADDPGLALLLAVESARRQTPRMPMQNNALLAALSQNREVRTVFPGMPEDRDSLNKFTVTSAKYTADGTKIITLANGSEYRDYDSGHADWKRRIDIAIAQVWDASGELLATIMAPPEQTFAEVQVSPNGRWLLARFDKSSLVSYGDNPERDQWKKCLFSSRVIRVYNLNTGKEVYVLRGHTDRVSAARFDADGSRILTCSYDGTIRLWDTETGKELEVIEPKGNAITGAWFTPEDDILAVFPGATMKTSYAGDKGAQSADEIDPPFDSERKHVVQVSDGQQGFASMKFQITGPAVLPKVPVLGDLPFGDTGTATTRMWNGDTLEEVPFQQEDSEEEPPIYNTVTFIRDAGKAILGTRSGLIRIVQLKDRKQVLEIETGLKKVKSIKLSHDEERLAALNDDGAITIHDLKDGRQIQSWNAADWRIRDACFGSTSELLFAIHDLPPDRSFGEGPRGRVVILDVTSGEKLGWLKGHSGKVNSIGLSPGGEHVLTSSADGTARIWRADLQPADAMVMKGFGPVPKAIYSPDGTNILVASAGPKAHKNWQGFASIYAADTGQRVTVLGDDEKYPAHSHLVQEGLGGVTLAQFSHDGKRVLTLSSDQHVGMVDPNAGASLFTKPEEEWPIVERLPYTPVRVWDTATGEQLLALKGLEFNVQWAAFNHDGSKIVTLSGRQSSQRLLQEQKEGLKALSWGTRAIRKQEPQIHIWDGKTGKLLMTLHDLLNPTSDLSGWGETQLAISPDGKWIVVTELNGVFDIEDMKKYTLPGMWSGSMPGFSPDGRYLLTLGSKQTTVHDLHQLKRSKGGFGGKTEVYTYDTDGNGTRSTLPPARSRSYEHVEVKGHLDRIRSADFSPDGKWFATTSEDRSVRVWNSATGELRQAIGGHPGAVWQAAISPDNKLVATRSTDALVRVFEIDTGREYVTFRGHRAAVNWIEFSHDGGALLSASADGTARIWPIDPMRIAIDRLPRELTAEERARYEVTRGE